MGRSNLTPSELKAKNIISTNLNELLHQKNLKKVDVQRATNIPRSTISDYFGGKTLPSEDNLIKLAKFFNVDKSEIDPRFSTSNENKKVTDTDLDKMIDNARSFDGKPMDDHDREVIKNMLKGYYIGKEG
ncbi:transcriptional regulator with XRE-family HTH domain [Lactobacillus colini]|uniref:Transcriptional regulator with XRE-family HTH domain n=1 Tax=Lactobacillus colini TaxID=1819254 RepID=A0ABS4MBC8_9LACO|nr:helix-turn-helix transcriptional regulator [Lactobacillus colini]MBP2056973.1 transcriptional regulator with XRE-family HTH domain [Lactobacillus colini]